MAKNGNGLPAEGVGGVTGGWGGATGSQEIEKRTEYFN